MSSGIAVGMATKMLPHNLTEIYSVLIKMVEDAINETEPSVEDLLKIMKGPDFPGGGIIVGTSGYKEAFTSGRGRVVVKSKYEIEESNGKTSIVFSEIPYKVNKTKVIETIWNLMKNKTMDEIKEVRDESDKDGLRLVIILKKDANSQLVIRKLFKHTQLQSSYTYNNIALVDGEPKLLGIKDCLELFLAHYMQVVTRRTEYLLDKANKRKHLVEGMLIALTNIEAVLNIIRTSDEPVKNLMKDINLTDLQAEYIFQMRLSALTKVSRSKIDEENEVLANSISEYENILNDQKVMLSLIRTELEAAQKEFGDERRTEITYDSEEINEEDFITDETLIITLSSQGLIKAIEEKEYKLQNRGGKGVRTANVDEDETLDHILTVNSKENIMFFTNTGRCHVLKAYRIDKVSRTARGKNINNYLNLNTGESVIDMMVFNNETEQQSLLFITKYGITKRLLLSDLSSRLSVTKVLSIKEDDNLVKVVTVKDDDHIILVSALGQGIRIDLADETSPIRNMGRGAAGVRGMKLKEDDYVVDMVKVVDNENLLVVTENGLGKRTNFDQFTPQHRGGFGIIAQKINNKTGKVISVTSVGQDDNILVATAQGQIVLTAVKSISKTSRTAAGVKIIDLREGDNVTTISKKTNEDILEVE